MTLLRTSSGLLKETQMRCNYLMAYSRMGKLIALYQVYYPLPCRADLMQKEIIRPYFHYNCKGEATIIDSQYTFEGNYLAVSTSAASIIIYRSPIEQAVVEEQLCNPVCEFIDPNKNNCYLKLAWSFYNSGILAALSISNEITCFEFDQQCLREVRTIKCEAIPVFGCYLPTFDESLFSVAFSDGCIGLYNKDLDQISMNQAHTQSVNWLSWQRRLGSSERNKWIEKYYPNHININLIKSPPLLASGSSDSTIKIWKIKGSSLQILHSFKAHQKEIRQIMWKPNYFNSSENRNMVSCSEDGSVKFWEITASRDGRLQHKMKGERNFNGPVFRAEYNSLGSLIAISYLGGEEGKVETKAFVDNQNQLGEEVQIIQ